VPVQIVARSSVERLSESVLRSDVSAGGRRFHPGTVEQVGLLCRVWRHRERLDEERHRLVVGPEDGGPLRSPSQGKTRLAGQCVRLGTFGRVRVGRQVVSGEGSGELVRPEAFEEAGRSEVTDLAVAPRQRPVRDLADERLDERVLAALGRSRVGVQHEQLAPDEGPQVPDERRLLEAADRGERRRREALAEHRGVLQEGAVGRLEGVETARDEGSQRLRHGEVGQIAGRPVDAVDERESTLREQHADRLDGVERDAVGARDDDFRCRLREPRHEAAQQLAHRLRSERLEAEAHRVAPAGTPVRSPFEQLRAGEGQDVDRHAARPLQQVIDEVEQARVREVEVLEGQHDRGRGGQALEERPPGAEELVGARAGLDAE
jgi:hypothetical protein